MFAIVMLGALLALQLRVIVRANSPGIRAIQVFAAAPPLFPLLFSATYYVLSAQDPNSFGEPLGALVKGWDDEGIRKDTGLSDPSGYAQELARHLALPSAGALVQYAAREDLCLPPMLWR